MSDIDRPTAEAPISEQERRVREFLGRDDLEEILLEAFARGVADAVAETPPALRPRSG